MRPTFTRGGYCLRLDDNWIRPCQRTSIHVIIEVVVEASLGAVHYLLAALASDVCARSILNIFSTRWTPSNARCALFVMVLCPMPLLALPQYVRILHLTHPSCDLQFTNRFEHSAHLLVTFWHSGTPPRWPCLAPKGVTHPRGASCSCLYGLLLRWQHWLGIPGLVCLVPQFPTSTLI